MRKIKVEFAGREFSLITDEPDKVVEKVKEELKDSLKGLEKYIGEHSMEEILFLALANSILERVKLEEKIEDLLSKLKEWSG